MNLSKVFYNNNAINLKLMKLSGITVLLFVLSSKKILLKIKPINISRINDGGLTLFNNKIKYNEYYSVFKTINYYLKTSAMAYYSNFIKLHLVGLGYKNFVLKDELYILVGDCNYIVFKIPNNLKIYCKKNQIYVLGNNLTDI